MVARGGGYFGGIFKVQHGVTQGNLLSPTIFNVVVYAVLQNWVTVVSVMEGKAEPETEGFGQDIQWMVAYLYAYNRILVLTWATWLQRLFNILMGLFEWVGLRTKMRKTVIMACQPCRTIGGHSMEAYGLRMMGGGS